MRPGDRVGMLMLDTPDIVALHLAAMAAGAIAVAMSSRAGDDELAQMLAIVRPRGGRDRRRVRRGCGFAPSRRPRRQPKLLRRERELAAWKAKPAAALMPVPRAPDDPAFWVMTSGTTGQPKAVEHCHGNVGICAAYYEQVLGCTHIDRLFATSRFHFAYAIGNMFAALRMGASNVLLERWATAPSVAETVERFKPTVLLSVPAVYHRLLEAGLAPTAPFRALRHFVSAGERLPPQIWNAWEAGGGHPILDGLGCSECVYMVIGNTPQARRPGSSGQAMPSVELRIVDDGGAVVAEADTSGRLEVRMPSVCAGYRVGRQPPERAAAAAAGTVSARRLVRHRRRVSARRRRLLSSSRPQRRHAAGVGHLDFAAEIEDALGRHRSIAETAAVLGESEIGLAEIVLYVVPARGRGRRAAASRGRARAAVAGAAAPTSSRGGSRRSPTCRAPPPARSSATSCASGCGASLDEAGAMREE